ncbi:MAG: aldo/keto reductase [Gemmatimonadaceae bacterium]|nr:aldo/keto reductase [Gemmatimonadaceae bacterium]MDQ3243824.1 aldo/keto reductase [Gemmatimonadota bacterium]
MTLQDRIVLGTVQLGLPYGTRRSAPAMSEADAFRILDAAWALGVRAFDTAEAYGASAARLQDWATGRGRLGLAEVVTKCAVGPPAPRLAEIERAARAALARFEGARSRVLLSHGFLSADLWPAMLAAVEGSEAVAGQSVYGPEEVASACALEGIGRVQAPGNVLDRRSLAARGTTVVPLDIRSVYLQGVLLELPESAERRAPGVSGVAASLQSAAAEIGVELAPLLLASVLQLIGDEDRVIVGVDHENQLAAVGMAMEMPPEKLAQFQELTRHEYHIRHLAEDPSRSRILDPRTWPDELDR